MQTNAGPSSSEPIQGLAITLKFAYCEPKIALGSSGSHPQVLNSLHNHFRD
jgi:hypothetical protein